jgi:hypothetical protein
MSTPKSKRKRVRAKQEKRAEKTAAAGGTSGPVDREVDGSPDAVEARREAQSGPGATGVPHTGGTELEHPRPIETPVAPLESVDDETGRRAARDHDEAESEGVSEDPPGLREPEQDKIDPHTRHER